MNILLPSLGDIDEVEVTEICVAVGDSVNADDSVIVIESDKASMEVPAGGNGTITEIQVQLGDRLSDGAIIGVLAESDAADLPSSPEPEAAAAPEPTGPAVAETASQPAGKENAQEAATALQTVQILVPDLGDIEQVEVIEVAAQAGATVSPGDLLVVLESDKASMEIPAEITGELLEISVSVGDQVSSGSLLAVAQIAGSASAEPASAVVTSPAAEQILANEAPAPTQVAVAPPVPTPAPAAPSSTAAIYAGPATRRLAREIGVRLEDVQGSGNRGRITKDDVKQWAKTRLTQAPSAVQQGSVGIAPLPIVDFAKFGEIDEVPLSRIQKQVAANMQRSWQNIPHVTQHGQADIDDLEAFRLQMKAQAESRGIKLTPLPFIIKAVCHALAQHPKLNGSVGADGEHLVYKRYTNIGIAVDTPDGLVVPVIRGADQLGIWALAEKAQELADKARTKKLALDDLSGGTFTISSLGPIGGTGFTPIINAPEVAILGVAKATVQPVWQGEAFQPRLQLPLSLSYDHRVINGTDGGNFMATLTELLADIRRLTL